MVRRMTEKQRSIGFISAAFLMLLVCVIGSAAARGGEVVDGISVDHRGLLGMGEGLRTNLVAFGPGWAYAAQDYCFKGIKKSGSGGNLRFEGDFHVAGRKLRLVETMKVVTNDQKGQTEKGLQLSYTLKDAEPFSLENAYVVFYLPISNFADARITADGEAFTFPETLDSEYLPFPKRSSSIHVETEKVSLVIRGENLHAVRVDGRKQKGKTYELRIEFDSRKNVTETSVTFDVFSQKTPFVHQAGPDWVKLDVARGIQPGSVLDFSFLHDGDAPAGKYGRIINKDGHFAFEKDPSKRVRLVGANLCFTANFIDKPLADDLAATFKRMGYNTVRFHHTDVTMMKGGWTAWNAKQAAVINPDQLDRLDYLFAAMKKAGMYVTFDLYAMGCYGNIEGVDKPVYGELKALVPIHEPAFKRWCENALAWMNHVNPYTGLAWKDDPAIVMICPLNEDSIASVWWGAKDKYNAAFAAWKKDKEDTGRSEKQLFAEFLTDIKVASNRKIARFFEANGIEAMMTGSNWWDTMAQTFERDSLDVVDNHMYADHPSPHYLPARYNQKTTLREGRPTYMVPIMKAPSRVFGKPFTITEYNFCAPNKHRAEGGAMMGAYAALQNWDGLYRFAWAHDAALLSEQKPISGFDMSTDPISQLTERQILLMFGRGDVSPAQRKYVYAVTMDEATRQGVGDMWAKGLFPHPFYSLALVSQIGSQVVEGDRSIQGEFDGVVAAEQPAQADLAGNPFLPLDKLPLDRNNGEIVSDTGQVAVNNKQGTLRVMSPKTECVVAPANVDLQADALAVTGSDQFSSVSASSMDDKPLAASRRVLLLHLTNVINTNMQFEDASMRLLRKVGELPYLARAGEATVTLKNSNPGLTLYAVGFDGKRLREVETSYADGAYTFTARIAADGPPPAMIYELAAE